MLLSRFTGELKTLAVLDRERVPVYNLIARATDGGGRFCSSSVLLLLEDVNDNPPVFSSNHYTACVYENTATKALLTRVQAMDPDVGKLIPQPGFCHIGTLHVGEGFGGFSS
jgi:protocadherin Fat 1/2/3